MNHNGHQLLECASDHPPRPVIPAQPRGRREGHLDAFTLNLGWHDNDGITYSLTIRGEERDQVMADAKFFKAVAKAHMAKGKVAAAVAKPDDLEVPAIVCKIHGVEMQRRISKRSGGHYFSHALPGGGPNNKNLCFGRKAS